MRDPATHAVKGGTSAVAHGATALRRSQRPVWASAPRGRTLGSAGRCPDERAEDLIADWPPPPADPALFHRHRPHAGLGTVRSPS